MCMMTVSKQEINSNSHDCFKTLTQYLHKMLGEKDSVIKLLKDEIGRKNMTIRQLIDA